VRWSLPLGRIFGIPIRVHITFFLLLILVYYVFAQRGESVRAGLFAVLLTCLLFGCVVAHELGHSLAARFFGTKTRGIVLLPIGGVALLESIPREPHKEIIIALAGPVVSALLAATFLSVALHLGIPLTADPHRLTPGSLLVSLFWINTILLCFNLIPAFPMDGGRVLRGLLSVVVGWEQGTRWAARLGQLVAVGFVLFGLFVEGHWGLPLIGLFIFFVAGEEERISRIRVALEGAEVRHAMLRSFATLSPDTTIKEALAAVVRHGQTDFPVVIGGTVLGMITYETLVEFIGKIGLETPVRALMATHFPVIDPEDDLETVSLQLMRSGRFAVPVMKNGTLVGLLSWEQAYRFSKIRRAIKEALRAAPQRQAPPEGHGVEEPLPAPLSPPRPELHNPSEPLGTEKDIRGPDQVL